MSKNVVLILSLAAVAAVSAPTYAGFNLPNGLNLANGLSTNGLSTNGLSSNGLTSNGLSSNGLSLQAVRLIMRDGTELALR
jgi:GLTT repeat (6 copies)